MSSTPQLMQAESLRPRTGGSPLFEGADHGGAAVSFFMVDAAPGEGPRLHRHPYDEVFLVHEGEATFTVGDESIQAHRGQVVMGPRQVPHKFRNSGLGRLRMTTIHPSQRVIMEWRE